MEACQARRNNRGTPSAAHQAPHGCDDSGRAREQAHRFALIARGASKPARSLTAPETGRAHGPRSRKLRGRFPCRPISAALPSVTMRHGYARHWRAGNEHAASGFGSAGLQPSCAATRAPSGSTPPRKPTGITPRRRPAGSSNAPRLARRLAAHDPRPGLTPGPALPAPRNDCLRMPCRHLRWSDNGDDLAANTDLVINNEITTDNDLLLADLNDSTANGDDSSMWSRLHEVRFQRRCNAARYGRIIAQRMPVTTVQGKRGAPRAVTIDE
jgi:hypothetical protein